MSRLLAVALALVIPSLPASAGDSFKAQHLKQAMAYGEIRHLNEIETAFDKDLLVRLYEVTRFGGDCFKETHGVCQNAYYVSVSTFDEYPQANVFEIANKGEVTDVTWIETDQYDHAKIRLLMTRYTKQARRINPDLTNAEKTVTIELTPEELVEGVDDTASGRR